MGSNANRRVYERLRTAHLVCCRRFPTCTATGRPTYYAQYADSRSGAAPISPHDVTDSSVGALETRQQICFNQYDSRFQHRRRLSHIVADYLRACPAAAIARSHVRPGKADPCRDRPFTRTASTRRSSTNPSKRGMGRAGRSY